MNLVVPRRELVCLIQPHSSPEPTSKQTNKGGRPAFRVETMLRIHFLQQWFDLHDINQGNSLLHGQESESVALINKAEKLKAGMRAKV